MTATQTCPYCEAEVPVKIGNADGEQLHMMTFHLDIVNERRAKIGEEPLEPPVVTRFRTTRKDAPTEKEVEVSLGGSKLIGYYYIFRGDPGACADMLDMAAKVARAAANGEITIDDQRTQKGTDASQG